MRCQNCNFENRDGVKFCEECGEELVQPDPGMCPQCGYQNREGVTFCEECGAQLGAQSALAAKKPKRKKQPTSKPEQEPIPASKPAGQSLAQPIIVQVQQEKKRRAKPLWLVLLLLLLVVSCACLLMYDVVETPAFAAAVVDPILDAAQMRIPPALGEVIGGIAEGIGGKQPDDADENVKIPAPTCVEFKDELKKADLGQSTSCSKSRNECFTDIHDIEFYEGLSVSNQWDGDRKRTSTCEQMGDFIRCYFPRNWESDRVDYTISIKGCEKDLGFSDGWLPEEEAAAAPAPAQPAPPIEKPEPACCSRNSFVNIFYEAGFLYFDILCQDGRFADQVTTGAVYDGAGNFWTDVECKTENNDAFSFFACEGLDPVTVKSGAVRIDMAYEDEAGNTCQIESAGDAFQPPAFCPSGQSLCAGSCCSDGHCCTCNGKLGCWQSCSGCD